MIKKRNIHSLCCTHNHFFLATMQINKCKRFTWIHHSREMTWFYGQNKGIYNCYGCHDLDRKTEIDRNVVTISTIENKGVSVISCPAGVPRGMTLNCRKLQLHHTMGTIEKGATSTELDLMFETDSDFWIGPGMSGELCCVRCQLPAEKRSTEVTSF